LPKGTLFVVATPIGNLEDITLRALRILREVSIIAAEDTRRTAHLLARHAITTPTTSLHEHNERQKAPSLVERMRAGERVALVSDAGTPTISDPGGQLIAAAVAAGVRVEPIPGPSAILAALTASGIPFDSFAFMGFPPIRAKDRKLWFERLRQIGGTIVFFEAPHRIERTLTELLTIVGDCPMSMSRELTKAHEESVRGPITRVLDAGVLAKGEFTVVLNIGQITDNTADTAPSDEVIGLEFGKMTINRRCTRREAVGEIARRYGLAPNAVYAAIERHKSAGD
jgi:16S rRNA (cytidine1402-2'-O)-methyltransferase